MRKNIRRSIVPVLLLASIVLMSYGIPAVGAVDSSIYGVKERQSAHWLVMASSNVTTMWYSEAFLPRGNFRAPVGSSVDLNITSVAGTRCIGDISVGNLTLMGVSMAEASFNLLLGWYPFQPGLVCPVNWDVQRQNATGNGFTVTDSEIGDIDVAILKYLSGSAGTVLTYDKATGLLLNGYGSFGGFMIEVALTSTSIDVGSAQAQYQALQTIAIVAETLTIIVVVALAVYILALKSSARHR